MKSTSRFDFIRMPLSGLTLIQRKPREDERGSFQRLFCEEEFKQTDLRQRIVQINCSLTKKLGTVRGMHFQYSPYAEIKMVFCTKGEIFDVAVDIRANSPTFLRWHGEILSAANSRSLLIPEGFAHGFQTLAEDCEVLYLHTAPYSPEAEGALNARDPLLGIKWPLSITDMSDRDRSHPFLDDAFVGVEP